MPVRHRSSSASSSENSLGHVTRHASRREQLVQSASESEEQDGEHDEDSILSTASSELESVTP
jgi:hypothetical protein